MTMSDKIIVMDDGDIMQVGSPDEVYKRPNNVFVAKFIGTPSMNILSGEKSGSTFEADGVGRTDLGNTVPDTVPDGDLKIGFRPETVELTEPQPGGLTAEAQVVESTGSKRIVYLESAQGEVRVETSRRVGDVEEMETYGLSIDRDELHYFDPETGERLESGRIRPSATKE